jgi:hypothetical protein
MVQFRWMGVEGVDNGDSPSRGTDHRGKSASRGLNSFLPEGCEGGMQSIVYARGTAAETKPGNEKKPQ